MFCTTSSPKWRHACEIIAPSLTPIRSGEQKLLLSGVVLSQRRREHYEQIVRHVRGFGAGGATGPPATRSRRASPQCAAIVSAV